MKNWTAEIRELFLDFYKKRDHRVVKSAPLVPKDDPTLLFTSAGMVQFKKNFTSRDPLEYRRAVTIQKCLRATDIEEVGHTPRHLTFFEMLGHFSFGDYFKREAILWNWELFTEVFKLPVEKLDVSVYEDDDEAYAIWRDEVGIPETKIHRLGKKDNFWGPAGETGACGPCSEVYYDLGREFDGDGPETKPGDEGDRWIEVGNFVFPQYDMQPDGELLPLPNRGIDTGIGLERLAMVLEGKITLFETSAFRPIITRVEEIAGRAYDESNKSSFHVIADHIRALVFCLTEGILPANDGRGYVIRRILRRAAVQGHRLGIERPFLSDLWDEVNRLCGGFYPEIKEAESAVRMALQLEEERFQATLAQGLTRFEDAAARVEKEKGTSLHGEDVFQLYDTYGFPVDLTRVLAEERNLEVDESGFKQAMEKQRERSRSRAKFYKTDGAGNLEWEVLGEGAHSIFRGTEGFELPARILRYAPIPRDGTASGSDGEGDTNPRASDPGEEFWVVLDETPFYAESGGQVGDQGILESPGFQASVHDTIHEGDEIRHRVTLREGTFPEQPVVARVSEGIRRDTMGNHTATHLLHAALRGLLGNHVTQAGSLVAQDRLRFDFTHPKPLTPEEIQKIEDHVNAEILRDTPVSVFESTYDEAIGEGVIALFGEKYGDRVRRIEIGTVSRELCGGTHCSRTGEIGAFLVTSETGIAAGTRRIEAVTGRGALQEARRLREVVEGIRKSISGTVAELPARVTAVTEENLRLRKQVQELKTKGPADWLGPLREKTESLHRGKLMVGELEVEEGTDLRGLADRIRQELGSGAGLLSIQASGKTTLLAVVTDDLIEGGVVRADEVIKEAVASVGGRGGGRPHLAMAGVGDAEKMAKALSHGREKMIAALSK